MQSASQNIDITDNISTNILNDNSNNILNDDSNNILNDDSNGELNSDAIQNMEYNNVPVIPFNINERSTLYNKIEYHCTICSNHMVSPRFYEKCGHTFCEECMIKSDNLDTQNNRYVFEATRFKCPLCRSQTIKPWYKRPFNHSLKTLLEKNILYVALEKKRALQRKKDMAKLDDIKFQELCETNFSKMSFDYRDNKANELYEYILPSIFDAVKEGKSHIIIKDCAREIKTVSDIISNKLIKNNNIYRTVSTNTEFTIEIIPIKNTLSYDYVNRNFASNLEESDDEIDVPISNLILD